MSALLPGFAAAGDAQSCFRAVLEAMSRPGRLVRVNAGLTPPEGLCLAASAILLTLADAGTGVSLPAEMIAAQEWLVFHTGARLTPASQASFVLAMDRPALSTLLQGTEDEPETSATLIWQVASLNAGRRVRLTGPGIEHSLVLDLPLDAAFLSEWAVQRRANPRGVDVLLCADDQILALPRSVTLQEG